VSQGQFHHRQQIMSQTKKNDEDKGKNVNMMMPLPLPHCCRTQRKYIYQTGLVDCQ